MIPNLPYALQPMTYPGADLWLGIYGCLQVPEQWVVEGNRIVHQTSQLWVRPINPSVEWPRLEIARQYNDLMYSFGQAEVPFGLLVDDSQHFIRDLIVSIFQSNVSAARDNVLVTLKLSINEMPDREYCTTNGIYERQRREQEAQQAAHQAKAKAAYDAQKAEAERAQLAKKEAKEANKRRRGFFRRA